VAFPGPFHFPVIAFGRNDIRQKKGRHAQPREKRPMGLGIIPFSAIKKSASAGGSTLGWSRIDFKRGGRTEKWQKNFA
jgi:hypothetical protein